MRIEIPMLSPKELNPNFKGHWAVKAEAVRIFKAAAYYAAVTAPKTARLPYQKAMLSITLVVPDRRYIKDDDNALSSLKSAVDACTMAGILIDDDPEHLTIKLPITYEFDEIRNARTIFDFDEERVRSPLVYQ